MDDETDTQCVSCGMDDADPCNGCDEPFCESCAEMDPCPACGHQH